MSKNINLGYACLNTELRDLGIFTSRTLREDTLKAKGLEFVYTLVQKNLEDLAVTLRWNWRNGINLYRMSSETFPFSTHESYYSLYDMDRFSETLSKIGGLARHYGIRLTYHPGQFTMLSSHRDDVIRNSIRDIDFHALVLDKMGMGADSVIVVHGGSTNGGKDKALQRFKENFYKLSESAQKRLVVENCEMCYSVEDLVPLSQELQVPIVIDFHHDALNPSRKAFEILMEEVLHVWKGRGITPKFHLSESRDGVTNEDSLMVRRAHGDFVKSIPEILLRISEHTKISVMIEAKCKEQSVFLLRSKFSCC